MAFDIERVFTEEHGCEDFVDEGGDGVREVWCFAEANEAGVSVDLDLGEATDVIKAECFDLCDLQLLSPLCYRCAVKEVPFEGPQGTSFTARHPPLLNFIC